MNALTLTGDYWAGTARPALARDLPQLLPRVAAGLVGNGSECFGYDDALSRDHDWGVDFFLWVTPQDAGALPALRAWKEALFRAAPPPFPRRPSPYGAVVDAMTVGDFYASLIGCPGVPDSLTAWRLAPEENFALAVNGQVFHDGPGAFTAVRQGLLGYYPEDLRRKKLAARCMALAQLGQYNFPRVAQREDMVTLRLILADFSREAMGLVFHLNRVYRPYYKWTRRRLAELPLLGAQLAQALDRLAETDCRTPADRQSCRDQMEAVCRLLADALRAQGLSDSPDPFLAAHGERLRAAIQDPALRALPTQAE